MKRWVVYAWLFLCLGILCALPAFATLADSQAYYSCDSAVTTDDSGNGNTGTNNGAATSATTKVGSHSCYFDGSSYVTVSPFMPGASPQPYTFTAWLRLESIPGSLYDRVLQSNENEVFVAWELANNGDLELNHADAAGAWVRTDARNYGGTGTWQYITMVYNGTAVWTYVNGTPQHTNAVAAGYATADVGFRFGGDYSGTTKYFTGYLDELAIYDRALSQSEVQELYASGSGCNPYTDPSACSSIPSSPQFDVHALDQYDNTSLTNFTALVNGTLYNTTNGTITTTINWSENISISVWADNYFNRTYTHDTSTDLNASLYRWTALYAVDSMTNATLNPFNATYNGTIYNSVGGTVYIPLFNETAEVTAAAASHSNSSQNLTANASLRNATFTLYPDPSSIQLYIRDADTGLLITEQMQVIISSNATSTTTYVTTGSRYYGNLTADSYTVAISNENYTSTSYAVTVGVLTHQTLNAYLSKSTGTVTFTVRDDDSNALVTGAGFVMERLINASWTVISSRTTDITGRTAFQYVSNTKYRFTVTKTGYNVKTFTLDPILFTSYDVLVKKTQSLPNTQNYAGINTNIDPQTFYDGILTNITYTITSPDGALDTYGFNISYPGQTAPQSSSGSNANGGTLTLLVNISNATPTDTLYLTYWYDLTTQENRSYKRTYLIIGNTSEYTWWNQRNADYGFTDLEKALLGVFLILLVGGFSFYYGGAIAGGAVTLLGMGFAYYTGYLTLWFILPSILVGIALIIWRAQ